MARTVEDVAILLQAVAGYDPDDPNSAQVPIPNYREALDGSVKGLRIGVPDSFIESLSDLQPDVHSAFRDALDVLKRMGAELCPIVLPNIDQSEAILVPILLSEAVAYHEPWLRTRKDEYGRGFINRLLPGLAFTGADYVQAQRGRALFRRGFEQVMSTVDLIATPTLRETAPTFKVHMGTAPPPRGPFTGLFNLTGQPSISVPCGLDRAGLPIGLMLSGRYFDEVTVLRAADAYQRATDWHTRHPSLVA
jgi:aspartyl-tRNA(Asn)/glutamyl-tRNA(Gln) amidotransferase subunit A